MPVRMDCGSVQRREELRLFRLTRMDLQMPEFPKVASGAARWANDHGMR